MISFGRKGREVAEGDQLGPYRLGETIGEGGMGKVYRAVREPDGMTVALKVVKPALVRDEQSLKRFRREVRSAQSVTHKHLVPVIDVGEAEGQHFLAMPFCPGRSLDDRIQEQGPLPLPDILRMTAEVGAGLDALHVAGVVHRDIKPSNILLDDGGAAALCDFGLAKGSNYSVLTKPGQVVGTLDYLAPEMISGKGAEPKSDLYALGCVVYECLAGIPPFGGKSIFEVGLGHLEGVPPDPIADRDDVPGDVRDVVMRALAKEPADRPPTATAYAIMLRVAAGGAGLAPAS